MQLLWTMPNCSIDLHDHEDIRKFFWNMLKEYVHHISIGRWQYKWNHFSILRSDSCKSIDSLTNNLMRCTRSHTFWCPAPCWLSNSAKTSLVLHHEDHWSTIIRLSVLEHFLNECGKVFLKLLVPRYWILGELNVELPSASYDAPAVDKWSFHGQDCQFALHTLDGFPLSLWVLLVLHVAKMVLRTSSLLRLRDTHDNDHHNS